MQSHPLRRYLAMLPLVVSAILTSAPPGRTAEEATRIAVLPFGQLHVRADDEFLQAGFAETLTTALARVRSLQVVERGQIRRIFEELKLQNAGMVDEGQAAQIGKLCGARQVVLGAFMRAGNTIRVECRFVNTETGTVDPQHTATVRRKLESPDEVLDILDDVAVAVIKGFGVQTSAQEQQSMQQVTHATQKVGAFQYYTQAREKYLLYTPEGYSQAVPLFRKALEVDERYALAWAGLAEALGFWGYQKQLNGEDASGDYRDCLRAAKRAVEIAPNLGEAHRALAEAYSHVGEDGDSGSERAGRRQAAARKAIELNDRDAEAYYMLWSATGKELEGEGFTHIRKALEINPRLAAAHVDLGVAYKEINRIDDAVRHYELALEINPRDANAWNNIANAYQDQDKLDEAVNAYEKALAIQADDAIVLNNYGNALRRKDRYDDAIAAYQKALRINPRYAIAHYNLGVAYRRLDKLSEAEASYLRAIEHNPKDPDFFTALGTVYRQQKRYDKALEVYGKALNLKEEDSVTWYFIGECHKAIGLAAQGETQAKAFRQAVDAYLTCAKYDPKDPDPWFAMGIVYDKMKRLDDSISAYRKAVELKPTHADANYNLAWQLKEKGDRAGAAGAMRRFLELARNDESQRDWIPKAEKFLADLGSAPVGNSGTVITGGDSSLRLDAEVAKYLKALQENPNSAVANYNLGLVYRKRGKLDQAETLLLRAIEINAKDPDFFVQLGHVYRERKQYEKAIRPYWKALNLREEDSVTYYWIGYCSRHMADTQEGEQQAKLYKQAIDAYQTCAKYDPKDPDPWFAMGIVYDKLKKPEECVKVYRKAVELKPTHADAWYNLAWSLKETGKAKEAVDAMKRFLDLARNDANQKEWIAKAEKFIRDLAAL